MFPAACIRRCPRARLTEHLLWSRWNRIEQRWFARFAVFGLIRKSAFRRHLVHSVGQITSDALEQLLAGQPRLARQFLDCLRVNCGLYLLAIQRPIGASAHPRIYVLAAASISKALKDVAKGLRLNRACRRPAPERHRAAADWRGLCQSYLPSAAGRRACPCSDRPICPAYNATFPKLAIMFSLACRRGKVWVGKGSH